MAPMFVDVKYKAIAEVNEVNHRKAQARIKTIITDEAANVVLEGEALIQNNIFKDH